jgi:trehalose/maltose hydrolase-like predicted phosphorylase
VAAGASFSSSYVAAFFTSLETDDPLLAAAMALADAETAGPTALEASHRSAWEEELTLAAGVEIQGNDKLAWRVNASLYALRSSLRSDSPWPTSPGGLPTNGYWGQTFWDTEIWIHSALLPFHPELALTVADYRYARIDEAKSHAQDNGYQGCMFPWQSGFSGHAVDLAPFANTPEQHISGDISLFLMRAFDASGDLDWLEKVGNPLAVCIAEFWASRVDDRGSILGVIPPDEFATGGLTYPGVNDNPWTNHVAATALKFAARSERLLGREPPTEWENVADQLPYLVDASGTYHLEYEGFNKDDGTEVKQADVTMLTWPGDLTHDMVTEDLNAYEGLYDANGPAMTWAVSVAGWAEAGELDKAHDRLNRTLNQQQEPFLVWTETEDPQDHPSDMGCYNFLTGAGWFLQAIIHVYGGLRLREDGLRLRPQMPQGATGLNLIGLKFQGQIIDARANATAMTVEARGGKGETATFQLRHDSTGDLSMLPATVALDGQSYTLLLL